MTHKRFKRLWTYLRLYLVWRELKRRPKPPLGPLALVLLCFACNRYTGPVADPLVVIMRDGLPACQGFATAKGTVLTASHCVTENDVEVVTADQWAKTSNGSTWAVVNFRDSARDLVFLTGKFNFTAPVSFRDIREGERLFTRALSFDEIEIGKALAGAGFFRDTTLDSAFGRSGSPVYGLDGKVVGLIHSCDATVEKCTPHNAQITVLP